MPIIKRSKWCLQSILFKKGGHGAMPWTQKDTGHGQPALQPPWSPTKTQVMKEIGDIPKYVAFKHHICT